MNPGNIPRAAALRKLRGRQIAAFDGNFNGLYQWPRPHRLSVDTHTLPAVAAMPGEVKDALPALTVMMVNGAWNFLIAVLILIAGWLVSRWVGRWVQELIG